jgi:signal transduction histidine kinase
MDFKNKILIVEDSQTQAEQLSFLLESEGFDVKKAKNGMIALDIMNEFDPDIVISDIVMPEMDGYEFCKAMKSIPRWKKKPVILLTSLSDPEDVIKGLSSGADNFLTKPYNSSFLLSRVKHILVNLQIRDERFSEMGIEIFFSGKKHFINSDRLQIIDLLLSTYENAILKNKELEDVNNELNAVKIQLETKNKILEDLNEQKNHFLGMAAHDMRNPLGVIRGYSEFLLEDEGINSEQKGFVQYIYNLSEFMLGLINDLLDISSIESGVVELQLKETDLCEFIKTVVDINNVLAKKKRISLLYNYQKEIPVFKVDPGKIEQLLNNLISNAIKFSYFDKKVWIDLKKDGNNVIISVRDEGQGIPPEELDLVFKPFVKASVKSTAGEHSTGLGLAIAKKIVQAHKGDIWVESKKDKGTTFFVKLPLKS